MPPTRCACERRVSFGAAYVTNYIFQSVLPRSGRNTCTTNLNAFEISWGSPQAQAAILDIIENSGWLRIKNIVWLCFSLSLIINLHLPQIFVRTTGWRMKAFYRSSLPPCWCLTTAVQSNKWCFQTDIHATMTCEQELCLATHRFWSSDVLQTEARSLNIYAPPLRSTVQYKYSTVRCVFNGTTWGSMLQKWFQFSNLTLQNPNQCPQKAGRGKTVRDLLRWWDLGNAKNGVWAIFILPCLYSSVAPGSSS
jgi:hypothetical protein